MSEERIGEFVKIGDVIWQVIAKSIWKRIECGDIYVYSDTYQTEEMEKEKANMILLSDDCKRGKEL